MVPGRDLVTGQGQDSSIRRRRGGEAGTKCEEKSIAKKGPKFDSRSPRTIYYKTGVKTIPRAIPHTIPRTISAHDSAHDSARSQAG